MKKYILLIVSAIVFAFTSCTSSEDIEINDIQSKYQVAFKINPATVVEPFTWQIEEGELSTIPNGAKLRIKVLIYDANGEIRWDETSELSNYNSLMSFNAELEKGNYTCIAISDVIIPSEDIEFWVLTGEAKLNQAKIQPTGWYGHKYNILGVENQNISVDGTNDEIKIDIKPAGAVLYTLYGGVDIYEDVQRYILLGTQHVSMAMFDSNGSLMPKLENHNNEYDSSINFYYPEMANDKGNGYSVSYLLPQSNLRLRFAAETESELLWASGQNAHLPSIKAGEEYYIMMDFSNYESGLSVDNVSGSTSRNTSAIKSLLNEAFIK